MDWAHFKKGSYSFHLAIGIVALIFVVSGIFKVLNIRRLKVEIFQWENQLREGQELWRDYPPLTPKEKKALQLSQERLFRMLPRDQDIPPVLEEISRLAQDFGLNNLSFNVDGGDDPSTASQPRASGSGAAQVVVRQSIPTVSPADQESSGPIGSIPLQVTFVGGYRQIGYFLEALQQIPRVLKIQSLHLQRQIPLVAAEVVLKAYYLRGETS